MLRTAAVGHDLTVLGAVQMMNKKMSPAQKRLQATQLHPLPYLASYGCLLLHLLVDLISLGLLKVSTPKHCTYLLSGAPCANTNMLL